MYWSLNHLIFPVQKWIFPFLTSIFEIFLGRQVWKGYKELREKLEADKTPLGKVQLYFAPILQLVWSKPTALCCYLNVNGAIRNLGLLTSTAPIFLQFNDFRKNIWVRIYVQFHFLYIFVGRVDRIHKTTNLTMFFLLFPFRPQMFWGRVEQIFKNGPRKYLGSW